MLDELDGLSVLVSEGWVDTDDQLARRQMCRIDEQPRLAHETVSALDRGDDVDRDRAQAIASIRRVHQQWREGVLATREVDEGIARPEQRLHDGGDLAKHGVRCVMPRVCGELGPIERKTVEVEALPREEALRLLNRRLLARRQTAQPVHFFLSRAPPHAQRLRVDLHRTLRVESHAVLRSTQRFGVRFVRWWRGEIK